MTEEELGALVASTYRQEFEGTVEGPVCIGQFTANRVWTYDGKNYHAHYVIERRGRSPKTYQNFLPFAGWLDKEFDLDDRAKRVEGFVGLSVATVVVLVALGLLAYLVIERPEQSSIINYLLSAVVGAAASYIFFRRGGKQAKPD